MYQVTSYPTPQAFLDECMEFLMRNEMENNMALGVLLGIPDKSKWPGGEFLLSVADAKGICATIVSRRGMAILSHPAGDDACIAALAGYLHQHVPTLSAAFGEASGVQVLARALGKTGPPAKGMLGHLLEKVSEVKQAAGSFHQATTADADLIAEWRMEFQAEVQLHPLRTAEQLKKLAAFDVAAGSYFIWKDPEGVPVSMAAIVRSLPNYGIIGAVYTPPMLRGKGYARSCVHHLSETILASGKRYSSLFTDVENPVSNHIYYQIGYRPRGEFAQYIL